MFWKNILRVSSTCKGVLDYVWIESRIKNAANKGVCFELVTALGAVVHRPSLFGDRLTVAESSSFVVVTAPTRVHHHWHGGASP
jgi:hypothetical protein